MPRTDITGRAQRVPTSSKSDQTSAQDPCRIFTSKDIFNYPRSCPCPCPASWSLEAGRFFDGRTCIARKQEGLPLRPGSDAPSLLLAPTPHSLAFPSHILRTVALARKCARAMRHRDRATTIRRHSGSLFRYSNHDSLPWAQNPSSRAIQARLFNLNADRHLMRPAAARHRPSRSDPAAASAFR